MLRKVFSAAGFLFRKYVFNRKTFSIGVKELSGCKFEGKQTDFEIREISVDEFGAIKGNFDPDKQDKYFARFINGMKCFTANYGERLAGIAWLSFKRESNEGVKINLEKNEAILLESFVFPEFRNKGLQKDLIRTRLNYLIERKYSKVYVIYEPDNEYSIRALKTNGFTEVKKVLVAKILTKYFQKELKFNFG